MNTKTTTTEQFDLVILSIVEMALKLGEDGQDVLDRLFPIVLSYAGIPDDTSSEACNIAHAEGKYPDGYYCHDHWHDRWTEMELGRISPVELLLECRREVEKLQGLRLHLNGQKS